MSASASGGWMRSALVALLVVVASCSGEAESRLSSSPLGALDDESLGPGGGSPPGPPRADDGLLHPVVLVTIDGARWQEVFEGTDVTRTPAARRSPRELVPHLERLARERGAAVGAPGRGMIVASGPRYISLPGYTEILTGRAPRGCQDNDCAGADTPTLLDEARAAGARVAAFGSWERLERAVSARHDGGRGFYVSCGRGGDPAVDPFPGHGDFRPDRLTADAALAYLEQERPDVLYVGLGEPDEYAHRGDYEGYVNALTEADAVVGRILDTLGRMGARGERTHVVVTADHGRAADFTSHGAHAPESSRVWLVASGPAIVARGRVETSRGRHLSDVTPTLRVVLGLPADPAVVAGRPIEELFVAAADGT